MNILGISNTKDSGAALIMGNKIIAVANEERFTRKKLIRTFPHKSIEYVLKKGGIKIEDVDIVTSGAWKGLNEEEILLNLIEDIAFNIKKDPNSEKLIHDRIRTSVKRDGMFKKEFISELKKLGYKKRIIFVDHHLAHASSAHYCSPFKNSLIIILDGRGDFKSNSIYLAKDNKIKFIEAINYLNSLGVVYGFVTRVLGFTPDRHEGKITGLAAFGNPDKTKQIFYQMLDIDKNGRIRANLGKNYSPFLTAKIPYIESQLANFSREDIAAGVQQWLEEIVSKYIKNAVDKFKIKKICLAGGIFANVKVNQRVREIEGVENVYIHPHMGDGGVSLGSALYHLHKNGGHIKKPLYNVYLGPGFKNDEIFSVINKYQDKINFGKIPDKEKFGAKLLANNKVVGWFQGRMEYGPRALCNRSILSAATNKEINHILNDRLNRTEFMPFAPVTLKEFAHTQYKEWKPEHIASKFMTMCYNVYPTVAEKSPAVVHIDNTARPQIISEKDNSAMHNLLKEYHKITGIPTVINTSFNNHEEPIVCTPEDAVQSLLKDNVDVLIIGDFVVKRKDN